MSVLCRGGVLSPSNRRRVLPAFVGSMTVSAAVSLLMLGCGREKPEPKEAAMQAGSGMQLASYVDETAEFPRLRFPDGEVSVNDRCPVRKAKLNRRLPPVYVNGHPVGFC